MVIVFAEQSFEIQDFINNVLHFMSPTVVYMSDDHQKLFIPQCHGCSGIERTYERVKLPWQSLGIKIHNIKHEINLCVVGVVVLVPVRPRPSTPSIVMEGYQRCYCSAAVTHIRTAALWTELLRAKVPRSNRNTITHLESFIVIVSWLYLP